MIHETDRFIRLPTIILETLVRLPLNGTQWRILSWVIRQTYGWHRSTAEFSWYKIARDLGMDRGGIVRSGRQMHNLNILRIHDHTISLEDPRRWLLDRLSPQGDAPMTRISDDNDQRKAMTAVSAGDDNSQRKRRQASSLFQRAKERSKERRQRYKDTDTRNEDVRVELSNGAFGEHHPAGAARPIPGKYDRLSSN